MQKIEDSRAQVTQGLQNVSVDFINRVAQSRTDLTTFVDQAASQITGIGFQVTADGAAADIHFSNADLRGGTTTGFASTSWTYNYTSGNVITSYTADAWVYLDNAEFAVSNAAPSTGSTGFLRSPRCT